MANNVTVKDASGNNVDFKTTDNAGVHTGHINIDTVVPGVAATSLGKAEDAVHSSGDTGVMMLAVRADSAAATAADGDYTPLLTDANGRLWASIGTVTPGTGSSNLGKTEDAAHSSGATGVMMLGVRQDTAAALAGTDGDYMPPIFDNAGKQWVNTGLDANIADIKTAVEGTLNVTVSADIPITLDGETVTITNVHEADFDTGAGTDTTACFGIALPASGGAVPCPGDATNGLLVNLGTNNDVTVTGSVTANAGTNLNTSALALESGGNLASAVTALQLIDNAIGVSNPIQISKTRPADTTTYASGDVINESASAGTGWTFSGAARGNGLGGTITGAKLIQSTAETLKLVADLWIFTAAPTADNDNAAFTPTDAEMQAFVCKIPFINGETGSGNYVQWSAPLYQKFKCAGGASALYGVLVAKNAYIPISGEVFDVILEIEQD